MGPDYSNYGVVAVLAVGYILPISQSPVLRILIGLDSHGRVAKTSILAVSIILPVGLLLANHFGWSIERAAGLIAIAVFASSGANVLVHGFLVLGWDPRGYFSNVLASAIRLFTALALSGYAIRVYFDESHYSFLLLQWADVRGAFQALLTRSN
jgi:hypothetical protein